MKNEKLIKESLIELRNVVFYDYLMCDDKEKSKVLLKLCGDLNKILFEDFKIDCYRMLKRGFVNDEGFVIWY